MSEEKELVFPSWKMVATWQSTIGPFCGLIRIVCNLLRSARMGSKLGLFKSAGFSATSTNCRCRRVASMFVIEIDSVISFSTWNCRTSGVDQVHPEAGDRRRVAEWSVRQFFERRGIAGEIAADDHDFHVEQFFRVLRIVDHPLSFSMVDMLDRPADVPVSIREKSPGLAGDIEKILGEKESKPATRSDQSPYEILYACGHNENPSERYGKRCEKLLPLARTM